MDKKYCVYGHTIDGVVRYIGEGTLKRAYSKSRANHVNWQSTFKDKNFEVVIFKEGLTKQEASVLELDYINIHLDTIVNKKTTAIRPINIDYAEVSSCVYYDETSPTCLRWVTGNKKYNPNDVAGYISKASSGYADVTINNRLYRVHRVIWVLFNKELSQDNMVDHISGDRADNRISNLRLATAKENSRNKLIDPSSTGLRNIRESTTKTGLSGFEVIWVNAELRQQKTFNINKIGSVAEALTSAYLFRDTLIDEGLLAHRLKDGEPCLDDVITKYKEYTTSIVVGGGKPLPKHGLRYIDILTNKNVVKGFKVRHKSIGREHIVKRFTSNPNIKESLNDAYMYREKLIQDGLLESRVKEGELSLDNVLLYIKGVYNV